MTPFIIVNGPGRDQLFDSFKRAYSKAETEVCFVLGDGTTMQGKIIALEHESGNTTHYNFKGYFHDTNGNSLYEGFYNTHNRKGAIRQFVRQVK